MGSHSAAKVRVGLVRGFSRRFIKDGRGATVVEFAMVLPPFLVLIFGILAIALQFFTILMLEIGVDTASRKLRTGSAQAAGMNLGDFKKLVCDAAAGTLSCDSNLAILISSGTTFASLGSGPSCFSNGSMTSSPASTTTVSTLTGSDGAAVMVTACYTWSLGTSLWSKFKALTSFAPLQNGKSIISARSMFRLES